MTRAPGRLVTVLAVSALVLGGGCSVGDEPDAAPTNSSSTPPVTPRESPADNPSDIPTPPQRFDADRAMADVRRLAGGIGPREATSEAYQEAADWVDGRLDQLGYDVRRQWLRVPAGNSWGVTVPAGRTSNVVAIPSSYRDGEPYLIVGAHLDTVPQAPGAEDNASGVSVMLELARAAVTAETRLPVVFVAFGAEEPRGEGDDWHHFGSQAYAARMTPAERKNLVAMVSLDRVGVGVEVPVCAGGLTEGPVVAELRAAARRAHVPTTSCGVNQSSDHWSFERAGLPAARLGSTGYFAYHSPQDRPPVVNRYQLRRTGRLAWEYLAAGQ